MMPDDWNIVDDEPLPPAEAPCDDRLNIVRIRAIALERCAAHRRLLWARAIAFLFAGGALMTAVDVFRVSGPRRIGFAIGSAIFIVLAVRAALRLRRFTVDEIAAPTAPPDSSAFDALSDGRQYAQWLNELTRDRE